MRDVHRNQPGGASLILVVPCGHQTLATNPSNVELSVPLSYTMAKRHDFNKIQVVIIEWQNLSKTDPPWMGGWFLRQNMTRTVRYKQCSFVAFYCFLRWRGWPGLARPAGCFTGLALLWLHMVWRSFGLPCMRVGLALVWLDVVGLLPDFFSVDFG